MEKNSDTSGGHGDKLSRVAITICGVAALIASLLTFVSVWLQLKNYRKPLLQRYVIRILLMVPIYSAASWASLTSLSVAFYVDPLRDIYEAFTIYTFFQLLINFLGGERSLIIMTNGRAPVDHAWPLNNFLPKVDISDPHTFLAIKRGILQYAWIKPILGIGTIIMKSTDTYHEGYLGADAGYLWAGIIYNISVCLSLYSLAMFWVCMSSDLKPFRPVPKFLCIKLIIFASYWQGFFLSILQGLGAIPNDVPNYTSDNLAAAIQDALICCEMPFFALGHWYAFSWHDYADNTISAARMPMKFALRDSFGVVDLIQDTKETFVGQHYEYRTFDTTDDIITHEESDSRTARMREGMRFSKYGKGKYWLPKPGSVGSRTPLLSDGPITNEESTRRESHGTFESSSDASLHFADIDAEEERLYESARVLEYGDWNYPVITAHVPSRERWYSSEPPILTTSTNRNILHPTNVNKKRRKKDIEERLTKGKHRKSSSSDAGQSSKSKTRAPVVEGMLREGSSSSSKSGRSQLVDLVIEDEEAEEAERVRARKEGGAAWNVDEPQHFVRTYNDRDQGEDIRHGFEPERIEADAEAAERDADRENNDRRDRDHTSFGDMDDRNIWRGSP